MIANFGRVRGKILIASLALGMMGFGLAPRAAAAGSKDVMKAQQALKDKGFDPGPIDGQFGPKTRAAIREYQKSQDIRATGRLDRTTAGKLGVMPESVGGKFASAGREVGGGGKELGHEMKQGKPIAAGKEFGKGMGRAAKKAASGVKSAVSPSSSRGEREKEQKQPPR